jgi:hypothetical protein
MMPSNFPESNCNFSAPSDMDESQVLTIPAFKGIVNGGNLDGCPFVVVAWIPTPEEIEQLKAGQPVYLSMLGGLSPHFLTTNFKHATYF